MMQDDIPWSRPEVGDDELNAIAAAFRDDWLTMGPRVARFEQAMAKRMQVEHAVAVSSGSVALDIALKVLGVGPGDEVIVPAITYFATAAAVSRVGATAVFVDVDSRNLNLNPQLILEAISPRTKGLVYIDYGGLPADSQRIMDLADQLGLFALQDAAHSLGGRYLGAPLGSQAGISTMSFHMAKTMTTIEGGMIFTHHKAHADAMRVYRNQGESGKYLHARLGYNARMNDIMAAVGLTQLEKLDRFLEGRRRVSNEYQRHFDAVGIDTLNNPVADSDAAHFLYTILIDDRDQVARELKSQGIDTRICYPMPLYRQEVYADGHAPCRALPCPVSESVSQRVLNLPLFPSMSQAQIERVVLAVERQHRQRLVSGL
ncbi:perosamine synthetase [Ferrimonas sediminum]|uniref:Perosamine synthetase n=1 Tax=Ferrimonas sediminum TaxID=718193 RepID=A0A1G9AMC7_9GAMM|nr:DegT/DnrJ/EryC1/StrS family aminotransferase [Ferrimonas sediminum]SDK28457.1 perosamine synthetase [Ferrimonas sediminum]